MVMVKVLFKISIFIGFSIIGSPICAKAQVLEVIRSLKEICAAGSLNWHGKPEGAPPLPSTPDYLCENKPVEEYCQVGIYKTARCLKGKCPEASALDELAKGFCSSRARARCHSDCQATSSATNNMYCFQGYKGQTVSQTKGTSIMTGYIKCVFICGDI
jgi:hypothetical protein